MLNHVILIRWKPEVTADEAARILDTAQILRGIEGVESIAHFPNLGISPPELGRGIGSILIIGMRDQATYEHYVPHPLHVELGTALMPAVEEVTIVDYESD